MWRNSKIALSVLAMASLASCRNLYRDLSYKTSTDYLLYQSERDIDALRFDSAIANLDVVLGRVPNHVDAKYMYSIAHSGRAGLRVIRIFETISDSNSVSLFPMLAESFEAIGDAQLSDFDVAVTSLEDIAPMAADRTADQNFYALFLYLGRIGAVLNRYAYDDTNALLTANFSACHTVVNKTAPKTGIPNDQVDVVMTMIPRIIDTVQRLSQQGSANLIDVSDLQAIGNFGFDPLPCASSPNALECLAVRSIINNPDTGIGLGTGAPFPLIIPGNTEADACPATTP